MADLSPSFFTGNSGEDVIELLCTATVAEYVISASYQFTWIKDDTPVNISNDRIMVCSFFEYVLAMFVNTLCRLPVILMYHHLLSQALILMLH